MIQALNDQKRILELKGVKITYQSFINLPVGASLLGLGIILALWEIAWKGAGLWRAAREKQTWWFVAILLLNTLGILPILYLYVFSPKSSRSGQTN